MPRGNNACRYVDFKCDLSGELLTFPGIKHTVKIGDKLGCGAYGDVFRGYIINECRDSLSKRNTVLEVEESPSRAVFNDTNQKFSLVNLKHLETVTIYSNRDMNDCADASFTSTANDEVKDNKLIDAKTDYAIKYFKDDSIQMLEEGFTSGTIRELSIMKSVGGHPNIIKLVDVFVGKLQAHAMGLLGQHDGITNKLNSQISEMLKNDTKMSGKEFSFYPFKDSQIFVLGLYEFCKGGDLGRAIFKRMSKANTGFTLPEVKWLSFQLLNGLAYLHNLKIEHRDLKPNNIMLDCDDPFPVLKIGDWGLGREYRSMGGTITPTACTMFYRPIEVLLGSISFLTHNSENGNEKFSHNYGINVDMWSAACIIAEMVTGKPLFHGNSDFQVLSRIVTILGRPTEEEWKNCSRTEHYPFNGSLYQFKVESKLDNLDIALKGKMDDTGLDLLLKMLEYNPHRRISAQEALSHEWFSDVDFKRLDSLGVVNCIKDSMNGLLGSKVFEVMEGRSRGILSTSLLSHVIHNNSGIRETLGSVIDKDHSAVSLGSKNFGLPVIIQSADSNP